ncbi:SLAM family member 9-like isoform X2 [Pyxicephalus adspersus]|uniref:SLAM family member 9-like isoform X2 n=1 Tax=Pyxicephalus adspersus TaxID=30357 RepID=UPI003B5A06F4
MYHTEMISRINLAGEVNVNGLQNQSITFLLAVDSLRPVEDVYWIFRNNIIGSYINSRFKVVMDEFEGRLEIQDYGRALRIGQLRLEDSGIYTGTITFTDKTKHTESYNLAVYEPAPVPTIRIVERKKMSEWCNITLNCFVSINTSTLSYVWKYRHRDSNYQLYNISGETIQTSLKNGSWDMEFMCIVKNPIDLKNVSVQKICQEYGGQDRSNIKGVRNRAYYTFLAFLVLPLIFLGWCLYGRRRKGNPRVAYEMQGLHTRD